MWLNDLIKVLEKDGWFLDSIRGSHYQFKHPVKKGTVTVSHPRKDLPVKTFESSLKQALLF